MYKVHRDYWEAFKRVGNEMLHQHGVSIINNSRSKKPTPNYNTYRWLLAITDNEDITL